MHQNIFQVDGGVSDLQTDSSDDDIQDDENDQDFTPPAPSRVSRLHDRQTDTKHRNT